MQVFAYKMCNFLKKVFQCPLNSGDFSVFIGITDSNLHFF